jgi:hypothetical protein
MGFPHREQNFAPAGDSAPQWGHLPVPAAAAWPHRGQKRAAAGRSAPQPAHLGAAGMGLPHWGQKRAPAGAA